MSREMLGSFSFDVTVRILDYLYDKGLVKRTNLATAAGMNYGACVRYLRMIKTLGWINITKAGEVSITPRGLEVRERLHETSAFLSHDYANNVNGHRLSIGRPEEEKNTAQPVSRTHSIPDNLQSYLRSPIDLGGNNNPSTAMAPYGRKEQRRRTSSKTKIPKKYTVMIVDDEPEVALTFQSFLASTGRYLVKAFTEPYSALLEFASRRHQYDLVILDIRMHDMNGLQLYQSLTAMNPSCKFMFVSSLDAARELLSMFPRIGGSNIIKKPVGKQKFVETVDLALSG